MNRAVVGLGMACAMVLASCGGSDVQAPATAAPTRGVATAAASPRLLQAGALFPDLSALGLARSAVEKVPDPAGRDIAFAVYSGAKFSARAEIRVYPTAAAATDDFPRQVAGWKSPPVGAVFPIDIANVDGKALDGLDEARAYVSTRTDSSGNRVWTDIYRVGRVVVVAHALGSEEAEATRIREELAGRIAAAIR